ncbi:DMT family transporter [Trinickia fusca]|uniref:DMT family transporter n=1 Tax=Trinickia fusca TaxID=2419777 RepID=UPI00160293CF|nr:DMT family transporter [Trinickia fusca]
MSQPLGRSMAAVAATLLWGSAFPFIKMGYAAGHISRGAVFQQLVFAGWRFALAGLLLCMLAVATGRTPWPRTYRQARFGLRIASVQTFLQYVFFYIGIAASSGISASLLAGTLTFFQLGIAHVRHPDDRLSTRRVGAALVGFGAVALYFLRQGSGDLRFGWGEASLLVAMFFSALGNVMNREAATSDWMPLPLTAWQMLIGGVALTVVGLCGGGLKGIAMTPGLLWVLIYLACVSACSFAFWNALMAYNRASRVSVFLFLIPVFGVGLSSAILHEALHPSLLLVLFAVAGSIIWAQREG